MNESKLIMIKNEDAGLNVGDVLEVAQVLGNVALLQVVHRKKKTQEIIDLPSDTLGISVSEHVGTKDKVG